MNSEQLLAGKVSDDVDLERVDGLVPLEEVTAILGNLTVPRWGAGGRHVGGGEGEKGGEGCQALRALGEA